MRSLQDRLRLAVTPITNTRDPRCLSATPVSETIERNEVTPRMSWETHYKRNLMTADDALAPGSLRDASLHSAGLRRTGDSGRSADAPRPRGA